MSVLQIYLHWVNSVLGEIGREVDGIGTIQEGKVLCQVIDILDNDACLLQSLQASGVHGSHIYVQAALDHMRNNGIKFHFTAQDIIDGDIKSMLDVLWLVILNYSIHQIGRNSYERSVGIGKKLLLDWCQKELGANFDPRNTLTYNLCTGDWFIKLLKKHVDVTVPSSQDKGEQIKALLEAAERKFSIKQNIVNPTDIVDGTIDEHTLMIYVSLLKRKVGGDGLDEDFHSIQTRQAIQRTEEASKLEGKKTGKFESGDDNSDWFSSTGSLISEKQYQLHPEGEHLLSQTISQQVQQHISGTEDEGEETSAYSGSISDPSSKDKKLYSGKSELGTGSKTDDSDIRVVRPRSHEQIMSEKKKMAQRRDNQLGVGDQAEFDDGLSFTSSEQDEGKEKSQGSRPKTSNEDIEEINMEQDFVDPSEMFQRLPPNLYPGMGSNVPIFVMPGQNQAALSMFLVQALRQARHEVNFHDQETLSGSEQSLPKLDSLIDLEAVDDEVPNVVPAASASEHLNNTGLKMREMPATPSRKKKDSLGESIVKHSQTGIKPDKESESVLPEYTRNKRSIMEVVSEPLQRSPEILDLSKTGIENDSEKPESSEKRERKHFKRVEIKEPVKNLMNKSRSPDRKSPDRDRSKSPAERRSRSQSPRDTRDLLQEIDDEETSPKSILRRSDKYQSPRSSLDRSRFETESSYSREKSPRYSPRSPRSPRYSPSPDRYRSGERSPRYSPSPDRYRSGTDSSPRYSPTRDRSPTFERTLEQSILSTKIDIEQENRMSGETSPGRTPSEADPNRRLARVLGKELELLKLKVEVLEKSNMQDDSGLVGDNVTQRISGRLKEQMKRSPSSSPRRHKSPDYDRGRMFRKKEEISSPQYRSRSDSRYSRKSPSPDRQTRSVTPTLKAQSFEELPRDTTVSDSLDGKLKFSPSRQKSRQIDLGYSSPVRKVSEEIWGIGHSDDDDITIEKVQGWKKLIAKDAIEDNDVLELKQALANCITENDIVRAQLNNANFDIKEKMSKTNDVLNDVRSHLARSQAENMELRTQLEKERTRNDSLEERIREHEKALVNAKSANADLEAELERTVSLLKGTSKKEIPTLQNLTEERDELKDLLANTHRDNTVLREDLDQAKKQNTKAQTTINDLRGILEEAKKERKQLFDEISQLHKEGHLNKISNIINNYVEQELYQEGKTNGYVIQNRPSSVPSPRVPSPRVPSPRVPSPRSRFDQSYVESVVPPSPRSRSTSAGKSHNEPPAMNRSPVKNNSFSKSGAESQRHLRQESPSYSSYYLTPSRSTPVNEDNTDYYDYEDVSPTVPSSYREIYPHRRSRSYVSNFSSPYDKDDYMDDLEVQKLMCKQPFGRLDFDNELDGGYSPRLSRKDIQRYPTPPRQNKSPVGTSKHWYGEDNDPYYNSNYDEDRDSVESVVESPIDNRFRDESLEDRRKMIDLDNSINDKKFLQALDGAVKGQTKKCLDDMDALEQKLNDQKQSDHLATRVGRGRSYLSRSMSPGLLKGILKKTKSEQNMNIKERNFPSYRSYYSHSASPARTVTLGDKSPSFTPSKLTDNSYQSWQTSKSAERPAGFSGKSSIKPSCVKSPDVLFGDDSYTQKHRVASPVRYQPLSDYDNESSDKESRPLSEEEKRYADSLVEKYTRPPFRVGCSMSSYS